MVAGENAMTPPSRLAPTPPSMLSGYAKADIMLDHRLESDLSYRALSRGLVLLLCVVYGVTVPGESASLTAGAVSVAGPGQRGATMAMHSFIGFAGAFAGPLAFGMILDAAGGGGSLLAWGLAFGSSGLAVALGPLAILWLIRAKQSAGGPST